VQVGFQPVFFKACLTVSWEIGSAISGSAALSAGRRSVRREYPCGGPLQRNAIRLYTRPFFLLSPFRSDIHVLHLSDVQYIFYASFLRLMTYIQTEKVYHLNPKIKIDKALS
jgi:hypothetical protein